MNSIEEMLKLALAASEKAYAPYSNFHVGACIRTKNNKLFSGCNVENASYGLSVCAEANAINHMILTERQEITEILVTGSSDVMLTPCGACRQRIREFSRSNAKVHLCAKDRWFKTLTIGELLPESFGPNNFIEHP